eukprot:gene29611-36898_t
MQAAYDEPGNQWVSATFGIGALNLTSPARILYGHLLSLNTMGSLKLDAFDKQRVVHVAVVREPLARVASLYGHYRRENRGGLFNGEEVSLVSWLTNGIPKNELLESFEWLLMTHEVSG